MKRLRTLIADDNPVFLQSIASFLGRRGRFSVVRKTLSGQGALQGVRDLQPDLVLLDLVMPDLNGLEVATAIRAGGYDPRIIVLTLADHPDYRDHAITAGADDLLSKHELTTRLVPLINELCPVGPNDIEVGPASGAGLNAVTVAS